jgi:hypothetical protein
MKIKNSFFEIEFEFSLFKKPKEDSVGFKKYRRSAIAELRPYLVGEVLDEKVSVSKVDRDNGSPKEGDMIARNPDNHNDQWLVAKDYFLKNFEEI